MSNAEQRPSDVLILHSPFRIDRSFDAAKGRVLPSMTDMPFPLPPYLALHALVIETGCRTAGL